MRIHGTDLKAVPLLRKTDMDSKLPLIEIQPIMSGYESSLGIP